MVIHHLGAISWLIVIGPYNILQRSSVVCLISVYSSPPSTLCWYWHPKFTIELDNMMVMRRGELGLGNGDITQKKKAEERDNKDTIVEQNLMDEKTSDGDDFDDLNITPRPQYICLVCLLPCTCWFNLQPSFLLTSQVTFFLTIIIITVVAMHCHRHHDCHQGAPS